MVVIVRDPMSSFVCGWQEITGHMAGGISAIRLSGLEWMPKEMALHQASSHLQNCRWMLPSLLRKSKMHLPQLLNKAAGDEDYAANPCLLLRTRFPKLSMSEMVLQNHYIHHFPSYICIELRLDGSMPARQ